MENKKARIISWERLQGNLFVKSEDLKENVEMLQEQKEEVDGKIRDLYDRKDEAREKFLNMHEYNKQKAK